WIAVGNDNSHNAVFSTNTGSGWSPPNYILLPSAKDVMGIAKVTNGFLAFADGGAFYISGIGTGVTTQAAALTSTPYPSVITWVDGMNVGAVSSNGSNPEEYQFTQSTNPSSS